MILLPDIEIGRRKILKDCDIKRHRIAAIAFISNGHVIAVETNRKGSGDISDFSFHAEEFLERKLRRIKARERFGRIYVLVTRLGRQHGWTLAKPCEGCARKLLKYGSTILYTDEDGIVRDY